MKRRYLSLFMVIILMSALMSGCNSRQPKAGNTSTNIIKIGVFEPLSGANAAGGKLELEGVKLANKLYPFVLGKKIELVIGDNKSSIVEASNVAGQLVDKDKVVAVIGSWGSSLSMVAGDTFKIANVPAVGVSCTNPLVTQGNDYYFRVCFLDPYQARVMANYAYYKLNARRISIIKEGTSDYAIGLAKFFSDSFKDYTGNDMSIISESNYKTGDRDFTSQLKRIMKKNPDAIFAPGNFTESALIVKQARKMGIKVPFIGGDTWETPEFLKAGGNAVEGVAFTTFFSKEKLATEEARRFIDAYKQEYKDNNDPPADIALAYDAYLLIINAINRAGEANSVKIRDELLKTKNFLGAGGVVNFDENRNAIKNAIIKTVKNGKFVYLYTYDINEKKQKNCLKK